MKKSIILLLSICLLQLSFYGQNKVTKTAQQDSTFIIGNYKINPKMKTVGVGRMVGGVNWDGYAYPVDPKINFDTTNLIFIGNRIFIKEYFPFKCDFNNLKVLKSNEDVVVFSDKKKIYTLYNSIEGSFETDISKFKKVTNQIYLDSNGDLILMENYRTISGKIKHPFNIDIKTLEYVAANYIKDKNGLYLFSNSPYQTGFGSLTKVCDSNGINTKPVITKNYFIYGKKVFALGYYRLELKLNKDKMWEVFEDEFNNYCFLTDGKKVYKNNRYGYEIENTETVNPFFSEGFDIKQIYPNQLQFIQKNETDLLFKGVNYFSSQNPGWLVETSNGYYFIPNRYIDKAQKINKVFIYNIDTKKEEELSKQDFRYFKENTYTYKNHLFFESKPVLTTMDIKNIRLLYKGDKKTNFITDGKKVMCIGDISGYRSRKINDIEYLLFEENSLNDFLKLKVINKNILIDDKNIYNRDIVIPIQKLGIPIKVYQ